MGEPPDTLHLLAPLLRCIYPSGVSRVERVTEGASTWVYRIVSPSYATCYLRILPEADATFGPEVAAHEQMRALGVGAPEVIAYEAMYAPLQRSVMIVREIPGQPLSQSTDLDPASLNAILEAAGRDLARINSIRVDGFGWITRDAEAQGLRAPLPTSRAFALEEWTPELVWLAEAGALLPDDIAQLERVRERYDPWLDDAESRLAHGDFDATAIFQRDGQYTGVIDFGEMRGATRWYDLAHFAMRDGEYLQAPLLPSLLRGYAEVAPLPADALRRIHFASLFINVRTLSRSLRKRPPNRFTGHQIQRLRAGHVDLTPGPSPTGRGEN